MLGVAEQLHTQDPQRLEYWLRVVADQTFTGFSHGWKRLGTTTLRHPELATTWFTGDYHRRRREIHFLNRINWHAEFYAGFGLQVVCDNFNTNQPKRDYWPNRQHVSAAIDLFIQTCNLDAHFFWTAKAEVRQESVTLSSEKSREQVLAWPSDRGWSGSATSRSTAVSRGELVLGTITGTAPLQRPD